MKTRTAVLVLILICTAFFLFKISLANQTPYFTFESYSHLRHANSIHETGMPLLTDELSYQGRQTIIQPLYHYLISFGYEKIITNLLIIIASILVFFLAKELTKDNTLSLIAAIVSLFIPVSMTVSNITLDPVVLALPLCLLFILAYFRFAEWGLIPLLVSYGLLLMTSNISVVLLVGMLAHLALQKIQNVRPSKKFVEITLFLAFFTIWIFAITIKDSFALQSFRIIWQNIPTQEINNYYSGFDITAIITAIGVIPLIFGIIGLNKTLSTKNKNTLFITSLTIIFFTLSILRIIPLTVALLFLGFFATILTSIGLKSVKEYFSTTRLNIIYKFGMILLILIFSVTTFIPILGTALEVQNNIPNTDYINALEFVKEEIKPHETILSNPYEANFIMYYTNRKTYYDSNYQFSNAQERYDNALIIYKQNSPVSQIKILEQENINYIFMSDETKNFYEIESFNLARTSCIIPAYQSVVLIYENECKIE